MLVAVPGFGADVDILMCGPFGPPTVGVLEPDVRSDHVGIAIAVDITDAGRVDCAVNDRANIVSLPLLPRMEGDLVPI